LQPPHSPIDSEREENTEIESFEERIAHFDIETPVQQWYNDTSFSGFGFDYGHLTLRHLTPLRLILIMMKRAEKKMKMMSEAFRRTPRYLFDS
jgi:hypothetical protein